MGSDKGFPWGFGLIVVALMGVSYWIWHNISAPIEPEMTPTELPDETEFDPTDVPAATSTDATTTAQGGKG